MKQVVIRSMVFLFLAAAMASASTIQCADQTNDATGVGGSTMDKYIALNANPSPGCMVGNLLFTNFAYNYTPGTDAFYVSGPRGTGNQQPSSSVVLAVNPLNDRFQFQANWIVNHYQTATISLSYTVSAPSGNLLKTLISTFNASQVGAQNGGPIHTLSATCTSGTCGSPTNFTSASVNIAPTPGGLNIVNSVFMNANGSTSGSSNLYHLSIITNQFAVSASAVPEPAPYLFTSFGLCALGLLRRRKQA